MVQSNIIQDRLQELFPIHYRNGNILMINADCMEVMKHIKDNEVELSCVDPPYGLGSRLSDGAGKMKDRAFKRLYRESTGWDEKPSDEFFKELFRVSKNQIIWGGNYFNLPPSRCMICWDKKQKMPTLSAWELGWTSFDKPSKIFQCVSTDKNRFHPTQKPIELYKWCLSKYAKAGDKILDTHGGSGSICIACHDLGFDLTWMELDEDYYNAAVKRYKDHAAQAFLFEPEPEKLKQAVML